MVNPTGNDWTAAVSFIGTQPLCYTVAFLLKISSKSIQILTWECLGCLKKQKGSRNSNLLSNCAVFQPKLNKLWKTIKTTSFSTVFGRFERFSSFIQFWLKTAQLDSKFEFLDPFCFFCHPKQQVRVCKEGLMDFAFLFGILSVMAPPRDF